MGDKGEECLILPQYLDKKPEPPKEEKNHAVDVNIQKDQPKEVNGKIEENGIEKNGKSQPNEENGKIDGNVENNQPKDENGRRENRHSRRRQEKKEKRGRNQNRPPPMKFRYGDKLCPLVARATEDSPEVKCTHPNCGYQHDPEKYLSNKPEDAGDECHIFKTYGKCEVGLACRFGKMHIKDNKYNVINKEVYKEGITAKSFEKNICSRDLKETLRKHRYDFKDIDKLVDRVYQARANAIEKEEAKNKSTKDQNVVSEPEAKKLKVEEKDENMDIEIKGESESKKVDVIEGTIEANEKEFKKIDWKNKIYLAPLTTVGNMPFRRICKKFGVDITCGEMAMTDRLLQGHQPEWALVQRHECEDIFGIQLAGCHPHQFGRVAKIVEDGHMDIDFIDLNLGCPIDLVYKRGMGSGLMVRKKPLEVMIRSMTEILNRPLTVKIRTGIYMDKRIAHNLAPNLKQWGADMVTLHGRSREQRYTKLADWNYIGEVAKSIAPLPLFGNGDLINYEDYNEFKERSGVAGCMIARGALIKPWVFTEIKEQRHWDISAQERLEMMKDYVNYGLEHWGSDDHGVETTRRFLLEWLSFLHRYVPVGLLERPPQRMNERVPKFHGRCDIETLLASPYGPDWVKITEMFLGKVPEGFAFEPKHKAHAYK